MKSLQAAAPAAAFSDQSEPPSPSQAMLVQERMRSCQGMVKSIAWSIARKLPPHVELDDLIGYGQLGLAQAARDFDPGRGNKFTTYAFYRVRGAVYDGLSRMNWFNWSDYHGSKYEQMASEVLGVVTEQRSGAEAEGEWLADTGAALAISYLAGEAGGSDGDAEHSLNPEALAIRKELVERLRLFISELPSDARLLIMSVYYEGLTFTEAAARLGVSKSWVSRLHVKTLERLARAMRLSNLHD